MNRLGIWVALATVALFFSTACKDSAPQNPKALADIHSTRDKQARPALEVPTDPSAYQGHVNRWLKGDVRFDLNMDAGCSGCSGGGAEIKHLLVDRTLFIAARPGGCSGICQAYWPAHGSFTIEGLTEGEYAIHHPNGSLRFSGPDLTPNGVP